VQAFDERGGPPRRTVRLSWGLLSAAFSDDTAGVRWYLHVESGEIVRVVEDEHPPGRLLDAGFIGIERARSKEQYRWMERYIASLADRALAAELARAISGKQAFQRFKVVLAAHPGRTDEWHRFRSGQLLRYMHAWLRAHAIQVPGEVPFVSFAMDGDEPSPPQGPPRGRLDALLEGLSAADLEALLALAELLDLNARARRNQLR